MKQALFLFTCLAGALSMGFSPALANDRYIERPPVRVSPDLAAPWVLQLGKAPDNARRDNARRAAPEQRRVYRTQPAARTAVQAQARQRVMRPQAAQQARPARVQQVSAPRTVQKRTVRPQINPIYLPQVVNYDGKHKPGTVIIDTRDNFLFLVENGGKARRYGVGTGKPGFEWAGTHKVSAKREWPDWRPPAEMIAREKARGSISARRSTASTAPTSHGRSAPPSLRAASACATRTWSIFTSACLLARRSLSCRSFSQQRGTGRVGGRGQSQKRQPVKTALPFLFPAILD
jgi:lipoprotein-anchoring transpeptidase ErfK/SrfK